MSGLFVIRQLGRDLYWNCSTEHGCGWNPQRPKQAFSKSELTREILRLIEGGDLSSVEIIQLRLPNEAVQNCCDSAGPAKRDY